MLFTDRHDAGRRLARALGSWRAADVVVLGLPRGGVPVAFEVARALGAPLDVILVRKLGVPDQPELAMGAVGEGDVSVLNERVLRAAGVSAAEVSRVERRERAELDRQAEGFRGDHRRLLLAGRTVIVVDDGIATGSTARAACRVARVQGAARIVLAAPVGAPDSVLALSGDADAVICLSTPHWFGSVSKAYANFRATSDAEVQDLLHRAAQAFGAPDAGH